MKTSGKPSRLPVIGWRERIALPELGISKLICKVDTGAKTSALHAFYVDKFTEDGIDKVKFGLHPNPDHTEEEIHCVSKIFDERAVTDSGGHTEMRYVIKTPLILGHSIWDIQITLTNRDSMKHRMLLGRMAIVDNFLVDSGSRYLAGKPSKHPQPLSAHIKKYSREEEE